MLYPVLALGFFFGRWDFYILVPNMGQYLTNEIEESQNLKGNFIFSVRIPPATHHLLTLAISNYLFVISLVFLFFVISCCYFSCYSFRFFYLLFFSIMCVVYHRLQNMCVDNSMLKTQVVFSYNGC